MYADLRAQAIRMLRCDLIHGDLSPYNVLVGSHGPVVIDFRTDWREKVYPMVPAGHSNDDVILGPEFGEEEANQ